MPVSSRRASVGSRQAVGSIKFQGSSLTFQTIFPVDLKLQTKADPQSRRDKMFIVRGLQNILQLRRSEIIVEAIRRLQHFAPPELWPLGAVVFL